MRLHASFYKNAQVFGDSYSPWFLVCLFVCWLEANGIQELTVITIFLSKVCIKLLQPAYDKIKVFWYYIVLTCIHEQNFLKNGLFHQNELQIRHRLYSLFDTFHSRSGHNEQKPVNLMHYFGSSMSQQKGPFSILEGNNELKESKSCNMATSMLICVK